MKAPSSSTRELSPGFDLQALRSLLMGAGSPEEAAFVGHEPDLGILAAALLAVPEGFPLRKGAVLALEVEIGVRKGAAKLLWKTDGKGTVTRLGDARGA